MRARMLITIKAKIWKIEKKTNRHMSVFSNLTNYLRNQHLKIDQFWTRVTISNGSSTKNFVKSLKIENPPGTDTGHFHSLTHLKRIPYQMVNFNIIWYTVIFKATVYLSIFVWSSDFLNFVFVNIVILVRYYLQGRFKI